MYKNCKISLFLYDFQIAVKSLLLPPVGITPENRHLETFLVGTLAAQKLYETFGSRYVILLFIAEYIMVKT